MLSPALVSLSQAPPFLLGFFGCFLSFFSIDGLFLALGNGWVLLLGFCFWEELSIGTFFSVFAPG
ncbi:hypothetical protein V8C26DRAFT_386658 [Trichoderma gracile]